MCPKNLSMLNPGESALVKSVNFDDRLTSRLRELGFTFGAKAECLFQSSDKQLKAYRIRAAVIALRNSESSRIQIDCIKMKGDVC